MFSESELHTMDNLSGTAVMSGICLLWIRMHKKRGEMFALMKCSFTPYQHLGQSPLPPLPSPCSPAQPPSFSVRGSRVWNVLGKVYWENCGKQTAPMQR